MCHHLRCVWWLPCSSSLQHVANDGDVSLLMVCYEVHVVPWWAPTIHRLRDGTDVFVLLVYWVWKANVHSAVQMEKSILEITLSGQWASNTRASWGCMPNQMWFCILLLFKWQGICTECTPRKCHAWSEYSAWGTWCHSEWPKPCRYRVINLTVWDEEGQGE